MIRVLQVVSNISSFSGVMNMLMNYYRNIDRNNVTFDFLYYQKKNETFEDEINSLGGCVYYINSPVKLLNFYTDLNKLADKIKNKYDIIHIHDFFMPCFFAYLKDRANIKKMLVHAHSTRLSDCSKCSAVRNYIFKYFNRYIVDYYLACSVDAGRAIFGSGFLKKGRVVRNAIDLTKFHPDKDLSDQTKKQLGITGKFIIGNIGNFYFPKNHGFIISVFKKLLEMEPNAVLVLVGDGPLREKVAKDIADISDSVILLGSRTDVDFICRIFDRFIFPSRFEGLGTAMIEAQASGVPCVFSDAVPEEANIFKEQNIKLSLQESVEFWAQALLKEIQLPTDGMESAITAAGYNIVNEAKKLEDIYAGILFA